MAVSSATRIAARRRLGAASAAVAPTVLALTLIALALGACSQERVEPLTGYVEGEFVLVSSPLGGTLASLCAERGDEVKRGDVLFEVEREFERASVEEARARVLAAEARIANLSASRRSAEIDALRQQVAATRASLAFSEENLAQQRRLREGGFVSEARLDQARAERDRDAARLAEAQAQVRQAEQSIGREPEIAAARAEFEAARAARAQAATRFDDKAPRAPADARVADVYFRAGESVAPGTPVVSLLPPANVKLRFFVPQADLGGLRIGDEVRAHCDGCKTPISARIVFVSPRAEFTPPVIYGEGARAKLVFLVEARPQPADALRLHPGQPVDIELVRPAEAAAGEPTR